VFVTYWVILRCVVKIIRHFYNAYAAMDLKFEVYAIDYIRMTSFYVLYPLEYLLSLTLVIKTIPEIK
jgi:Protein tyrosine phosphatase-like protein, PTPLA